MPEAATRFDSVTAQRCAQQHDLAIRIDGTNNKHSVTFYLATWA